MTMDRSPSQSSSSSDSYSAGRGGSAAVVLSIECLKGSSKAEEWNGDMLQTGDIVEELKIGGFLRLLSPFKNGRSGVQKLLHNSFKAKETSILVRVRRGQDEFAELQACIVPNDAAGKKHYMLRSIDDPNYAVHFVDRSESECLALQASRSSRMVSALTKAKLQDGYVAYPWERWMQELLPVPNSSSFLSILLLPKATDRAASRYNDLEDTLARANAWLNASQASGIPIVFMNIQTESLLTKISGGRASSTVNIAGSFSDLSNLANASLYGFEDYHGVDIGVVRAIRLWYAPLAGELSVEIKLKEDDAKLGFAISRTEEGFIYISSVIDGEENLPATRSGLSDLYKEAMKACKLLVVSRVSDQKLLPWMVSSSGAIRCYDTISLSQKLSLHRHASVPIVIHVLLWERPPAPAADLARGSRLRGTRVAPPSVMQLPPELHHDQVVRRPNDNQVMPVLGDPDGETPDEREMVRLERDTAGEFSFRFQDFPLPNNWV